MYKVDKRKLNEEKQYEELIRNLINQNAKFYRFAETIKWNLCVDENPKIFGWCKKKPNVVCINIKAIEYMYIYENILSIEYFLLHEIRHYFQQLIIDDYINKKSIPIDEKIIKQWIYEGEQYVTALNKDNEENDEYYSQDIELDAYAFAFAVMKYKYPDVSFLYKPEVYGREFDEIVESWLNQFNLEQL